MFFALDCRSVEVSIGIELMKVVLVRDLTGFEVKLPGKIVIRMLSSHPGLLMIQVSKCDNISIQKTWAYQKTRHNHVQLSLTTMLFPSLDMLEAVKVELFSPVLRFFGLCIWI